MSEENNKIKEELISLFKGIQNDIPNDKFPKSQKNIQNISTLDSITLITYIKELIPLLVNQKISEAKTDNNNNNYMSIELEENSDLKKEYIQLENQLKKIENDNRYYIKIYNKSEIQKKILNMKLNAYRYLEEEYEELKGKVKYEEGKFLDNEKKENEIFILRAENSILKKEISKLEQNNKTKDIKIKEYQQIIKEMKLNNENLNQKLYKIKKDINKYSIYKNSSKNLFKERNNSMIDLGLKNNNNENYFIKKENFRKIHVKSDIQNMKFPKTFKIRKKIDFKSPKNDSTRFENNKNTSNSNISVNTTNINFLATIYNKLNKNEGYRKIPLIKIMKMKGTKYNSYSTNKQGIRTREDFYSKSNNKKRIFKNILYYKPKTFSPKFC